MSVFENSRVAFRLFSLGLAFCVFSWGLLITYYYCAAALCSWFGVFCFFAIDRAKEEGLFGSLLSMHAIDSSLLI